MFLCKRQLNKNNYLAIESVAKSLGAVGISNTGKRPFSKAESTKRKKWTRRNAVKKPEVTQFTPLQGKDGKRQLIDVMIIEDSLEDCGGDEKKRKQSVDDGKLKVLQPKVVLDIQHCLA